MRADVTARFSVDRRAEQLRRAVTGTLGGRR